MPSSHTTKSVPGLSETTLLLSHRDTGYAKRATDVQVAYTQELKILTSYLFPAFGAQVLEFSLIMASVVSIGHHSTAALSAISLGTMTANVSAFTVIQGFMTALDTVLPSAWTSSQPHLVGLWTQRMLVIMAFLLVPIYLLWFNIEPILLALKQEPDVAHLTSEYLRWVSLGLPAYAFNSVSRRYFQCQGHFSASTKIISVVAPLNICLNYLLVWGPAPFHLGFIGAPIATVISFHLVSVMSFAYGAWCLPRTAWCSPTSRIFSGLGILVRLGAGGAVQMASEWLAWEVVAFAATLIGPIALSSQSVLLTSSSALFQVFIALSVVTSVRIGNLLGEGNSLRAGIAARVAIFMAFGISILMNIVFITYRRSWSYMFNSDPHVAAAVAAVIPYVAVFQIFDANAALTGGILRARGKQVIGAFLNLSAYYLIGLPLGAYFAFHFDHQLRGLWLGLIVALIYCACCGTTMCLRTDWEREVRKAMARLRESRGSSEEHRVTPDV